MNPYQSVAVAELLKQKKIALAFIKGVTHADQTAADTRRVYKKVKRCCLTFNFKYTNPNPRTPAIILDAPGASYIYDLDDAHDSPGHGQLADKAAFPDASDELMMHQNI